jgi:DNA-binding MarR family transcriptional regulator
MDANPAKHLQLKSGLEKIADLVRAQSWREDGAGLPPTQRALLIALARSTQGLRAGEVAANLGVSAASLSDSVRAVEARGWLQRAPDPADARASRLTLTAEGAALAAKLDGPDSGLAQLVATLPEADADALLRAMQLLIREAQARGLLSGLRTCLGCTFFRPFASGDAAAPHFCAFVGAPFGDAGLRTDCAEQQPQRDADALAAAVLRFRDGAA